MVQLAYDEENSLFYVGVANETPNPLLANGLLKLMSRNWSTGTVQYTLKWFLTK